MSKLEAASKLLEVSVLARDLFGDSIHALRYARGQHMLALIRE